MVELVREKLPEIQALCERFGVTRLELFGSAARCDDFDRVASDIDLVASFKEGIELGSRQELHRLLEALFNRHVDLLDRRFIRNPVIRKAILEERVVLFAS